MFLTPIEFDLSQQIVSIDGDEKRSDGVHVTTIIHAIEKHHGRLKGRDDIGGAENDDKWKDYRTAGFLIERVFRELLSELPLVKVGEVALDGIYMTPDFLDTNAWAVEEWKCTWRSSSNDIDGPDFAAWWWQIKAYCKVLGCLKGRLRVFFINGNYRPRKPQLLAWEAEFTQEELDENWAMLMNWGKDLGVLP